MSSKEEVKHQAVEGDGGPAAGAIDYQREAQKIGDALAVLSAAIPELVTPTALNPRIVQRSAAVTIDFLRVGVQTLESTPDLQKYFDVQRNRQLLDFILAYTSAAQNGEGFARFIRSLVITAIVELSSDIRKLYAFTKALSTSHAGAHLVPRVEALKAAWRRPRAKAKKEEDPQSPAPSPVDLKDAA